MHTQRKQGRLSAPRPSLDHWSWSAQPRSAQIALLVLVAATTQCAQQTQMIIEVPSNLMAETDLQSITIEVARLAPSTGQLESLITAQTVQISREPDSAKKTLPVSLGIIAAHADDSRRVRVNVSGRRQNGTIAQTSAVVAFFPNKTVFYTLFLAGECTPPVDDACRQQGLTCGMNGRCVPRIRTEAEVLENGVRTPRAVPPEQGAGMQDATMGEASSDVRSDVSSEQNFDGAAGDTRLADAITLDDAVSLDVPNPSDIPTPPDVMIPANVPSPRLRAPLSTALVSGGPPTLEWVNDPMAQGAMIRLCRDRAMSVGCTDNTTFGASSLVLPAPLAAGWWYWRAFGTNGVGQPGVGSPVWQFRMRDVAARSNASTFFKAPMDLNNDGMADVAIGATAAAGGIGSVRCYSAPFAAAPVARTGSMANERFGSVVVNAGDINGDGYADIAIASSGIGYVSVYHGSAQLLEAAATTTIFVAGEDFGKSVASIGDVNGDGFGDLAVGAPLHVRAGVGVTGAAYVFLGSALGLSRVAHVMIEGTAAGDRFGHSVSGGGDLNGDGYSDLVTGAPNALFNAFAEAGMAIVLYGGRSLVGGRTQTLRAPMPTPAERFGTAVALVGPVNNDRYADLVISAPGGGGDGSVNLFLGGEVQVNPVVDSIVGPIQGTRFGENLFAVGDVNRDGFADVAVSAFIPGAGAVSVLRSQGGTYAIGNGTTMLGSDLNFQTLIGGALGGGGDTNRDGYDDLLLGSSSAFFEGIPTGSAFLLLGGAGLGLTPGMRFNGPVGNESFGITVASLTPQNRVHLMMSRLSPRASCL